MTDGGKYKRILSISQTPIKNAVKVPVGHIILCSKWRNTDLSSALQGSCNPMYEDSLGSIDFYPASQMGVVYASEADLVSQSSLRRKLAKLRKVNKVQVLVLAEKTGASSQYYQTLQKYVTLELGFLITPVPGQTEAAGLLAQIVHTESRVESNPFTKKHRPSNLDEGLLHTMQCVPKLGVIKARKLLEHFKSLQAINSASEEELSGVVGKASAKNVRSFFDGNVES